MKKKKDNTARTFFFKIDIDGVSLSHDKRDHDTRKKTVVALKKLKSPENAIARSSYQHRSRKK